MAGGRVAGAALVRQLTRAELGAGGAENEEKTDIHLNRTRLLI
jgi:hypothetical protein